MRLEKTRYSRIGGSKKFVLACDQQMKDDTWLFIKGYLGSDRYNVLLGMIKGYKQIIIKFGSVAEMQREYQHAKTLFDQKIPNFIKFLCYFACNDTIQSIKDRDFTRYNYICRGMDASQQIGVIAMPYYPLGNLGEYRWDRRNFHVLKNVYKQVVTALLYAYEQCGFVHGDMHSGNVILRASKKKTIEYGARQLSIDGLYAMVMDFGASHIAKNAYTNVYENIDRILRLADSLENSDIVITVNMQPFIPYLKSNRPIDENLYKILYDIIDNFQIAYVRSELPKLNFSSSW